MTFPFPTFVPAEEGGGIASIVQQASASSTSSTITWPAVEAGDIAVLFDIASNAFSSPTSVTPSGFTKMCESADVFNYRSIFSFKVCDGTESGSLTGMSGGSSNRKLMVTFRCTSAASSGAHGGAQNGTTTDGNPTAITVTSGSGVAPLIVVGAYVSSGVVNPRTFVVGVSPAKDGEVGAHSNTMYIAWKIYLSSPSNVTIDMDDEGSKNLVQGAYIQVS